MIKGLISLYSWKYPQALVYMLQSNEYQAGPYLRWYWQTRNFSQVTYRRTLDYTLSARLLLIAVTTGILVQVFTGLLLIALWGWKDVSGGWQFGLAVIVAYPLVWAHMLALAVGFARILIVLPINARAVRKSEKIFKAHKGTIIAITGSYGKTSMKELLLSVLGGVKNVAATPANKNVAISHARFAQKLTGDEDILLIEYGEGAPGDVARFARTTHPTHAIITGVAPAHLDKYKTVTKAAKDIFSVTGFVKPSQVYINGESPLTAPYIEKDYTVYSQKGVLAWSIDDVAASLEGTAFTMKKGKRNIKLHTGLLGRHHLGPLGVAVALGDTFGLSDQQIKEGIASTVPFEHRMQPYRLGGAWIIDDTYNGNIEGIRAGTALLKELPAERKIYVTPGLVDQGNEHERVHQEMGRLIAEAKPDIVVLMKNSATVPIQHGLKAAHFANEIRIEDDPLDFYVNLQAFVAAGDVVLMQNDWTDNYA